MARRAPAPAKPAIQSDEQAGQEAQEYLDALTMIGMVDGLEKKAIAALKMEFEEIRAPYAAIAMNRFERVQAWAETHRGDLKTVKFPNGREFCWRVAPSAKVVVSGTLASIIAQLLKRRDWKKFLKVELRKSSLSAHPKVVEQIDGLRLERGEYASIR